MACSGDYTMVFFDLETTGLDTTLCDVVQLSAISGDKVFNAYTLPQGAMTEQATSITGFTVSGGVLFLHGRPVDTMTLYQALSTFIYFLRSLKRPLLAAHSCKRFDAPVLIRALRKCSLMREFQELGLRFFDTFLLSKQLFPRGISSYSQVYLVKYFLGKKYNAHDALEDVKALQELYQKWCPNRKEVDMCSFTFF